MRSRRSTAVRWRRCARSATRSRARSPTSTTATRASPRPSARPSSSPARWPSAAHELSARRRARPSAIGDAVRAELAELALPAARFRIALEPLDTIGPSGAERAELRFAANPGEPERALARVASGGELSRVLLALVLVVARPARAHRVRVRRGRRRRRRCDRLGRRHAAGAAGARRAGALRDAPGADRVPRRRPRRAAQATDGERTTIEAVALDAEARRAEVARMLSGRERRCRARARRRADQRGRSASCQGANMTALACCADAAHSQGRESPVPLAEQAE